MPTGLGDQGDFEFENVNAVGPAIMVIGVSESKMDFKVKVTSHPRANISFLLRTRFALNLVDLRERQYFDYSALSNPFRQTPSEPQPNPNTPWRWIWGIVRDVIHECHLPTHGIERTPYEVYHNISFNVKVLYLDREQAMKEDGELLVSHQPFIITLRDRDLADITTPPNLFYENRNEIYLMNCAHYAFYKFASGFHPQHQDSGWRIFCDVLWWEIDGWIVCSSYLVKNTIITDYNNMEKELFLWTQSKGIGKGIIRTKGDKSDEYYEEIGQRDQYAVLKEFEAIEEGLRKFNEPYGNLCVGRKQPEPVIPQSPPITPPESPVQPPSSPVWPESPTSPPRSPIQPPPKSPDRLPPLALHVIRFRRQDNDYSVDTDKGKYIVREYFHPDSDIPYRCEIIPKSKPSIVEKEPKKITPKKSVPPVKEVPKKPTPPPKATKQYDWKKTKSMSFAFEEKRTRYKPQEVVDLGSKFGRPLIRNQWTQWINQLYNQLDKANPGPTAYVNGSLIDAVGLCVANQKQNLILFTGSIEDFVILDPKTQQLNVRTSERLLGEGTLSSIRSTAIPPFIIGLENPNTHFVVWGINMIQGEFFILDPYGTKNRQSAKITRLLSWLSSKMMEWGYWTKEKLWVSCNQEAYNEQQTKNYIQRDVVSCGYICIGFLINFITSSTLEDAVAPMTFYKKMFSQNPMKGLEHGAKTKRTIITSEAWSRILAFLSTFLTRR